MRVTSGALDNYLPWPDLQTTVERCSPPSQWKSTQKDSCYGWTLYISFFYMQHQAADRIIGWAATQTQGYTASRPVCVLLLDYLASPCWRWTRYIEPRTKSCWAFRIIDCQNWSTLCGAQNEERRVCFNSLSLWKKWKCWKNDSEFKLIDHVESGRKWVVGWILKEQSTISLCASVYLTFLQLLLQNSDVMFVDSIVLTKFWNCAKKKKRCVLGGVKILLLLKGFVVILSMIPRLHTSAVLLLVCRLGVCFNQIHYPTTNKMLTYTKWQHEYVFV